MKSESDPLRKSQLNIKQLALKILANSMYGCLGFENSRFRATAIASTVTKTGRFFLFNTLKTAEKAGFTVVYGDTDSIMINTGTKEYGESLRVGERIRDKINKQYKYLKIDIDYVFKRMLLLKKKKYAALKVVGQTAEGLQTTREVKGIDLVRRDWSILSKKAGNFFLNTLFSDTPRDELRGTFGDYLTKLAQEMRSGKLPLEDYLITKSLTRALKDYDSRMNATNPHVVVANRLQKAGRMVNISFSLDSVSLDCTRATSFATSSASVPTPRTRFAPTHSATARSP